MATRNNGKSIKMFYLSTNLPGKYQWLAPSLSWNVERPSWICSVNSIKHLILMSSLISFSYLNSAYHVTVLLHHFNCAMNYSIIECQSISLWLPLPLSLLTMQTVGPEKEHLCLQGENSLLCKHLYQGYWTDKGWWLFQKEVIQVPQHMHLLVLFLRTKVLIFKTFSLKDHKCACDTKR